MDKEKNIPSYKNLLEGLDYNPELVQNYFESIIESLEKELFLLRDEGDKRLTDLYSNFDVKQEKFVSIKEDILRTYLNEFIRLNEEYENDLLILYNDFLSKESELKDSINLEEDLINRISLEYAKKLLELTKEPNAKIREIYKRIDEEYQIHAGVIFNAREALLKNNSEYYLNAQSHIEELDKLDRFFKELNDYTSNLRKEINSSTVSSNDKRIQIYLDYISENKDKWINVNDLIHSYDEIENSYKELENQLETKISENIQYFEDIKNDKLAKLQSLDTALNNVNEHFDKLIEKETDRAAKRILVNEKDAFLKKIENDKQRLEFEINSEGELLNKDTEAINLFKESINNLIGTIHDSYTDRLTKVNDDLKLLLSETEELLNDTRNSIKNYDSAYAQSKNLLSYFEKRYAQLSYSTRIKAIEEYKNYLLDNVERNKKLDTLAFELLTNSEVRTLKLLDLEKDYLTVDENIKIKQVKYDIDREVKEKTLNSELQIKNALSEIELLKKDLEIDKNIKKHELDNAIKVLDLRKKIDITRVNYMEAYARLDNVKEMINIKGMNENLIEEINTQIKIQKLIEISLLESVSRREQFDSIIEGYDESIKKLDEDTQSKIRYQNDVLEIERDTFEKNKQNLNDSYDDLRKSIYPSINDIKKERDKKINHIKNAFDGSKKIEVEENKKKENDAKQALKEFKQLCDSSIKSIDNSHTEGKGDDSQYFNMINSDGYTNTIDLILNNVLKGANDILNKYYSNGDISMPKNSASSTFKTQIKKAKRKADRDKCYKEYKKESKQVISKINQEFQTKVKSELPESKNDEERMLKVFDELKTKLIAEEAIASSNKLSPYLDELKDVEETRNAKNKELEEKLQDFKGQYLDTIKAIESDYEMRLGELKDLKDSTINHKESGNADIDELIYDSIQDLSEKRDENIIKNDSAKETNYVDAQNKIESLSVEAMTLTNTLDTGTEDVKKDNKAYRDDMTTQAKEDYLAYQEEKIKNEETLNKDLKEHDENRQNYFKEIVVESLNIKDSYKKKIEYITEKYENKKADDLIEFEKLFDSTKVKSLLAHDDISKPLVDLELEINKLTLDLIKQAEKLNDEMTKSSKEEYSKILSNLEEKDKILEGGKK